MSEQMKPCPFPHSAEDGEGNPADYPPSVVLGIGSKVGECWVECEWCGASGPAEATEAAAIAAWNKRAAPKPAPEALHGYWQVEPIEGQMPTITTTYCQGCQEKEAELASLRQEKNEAIGAALAVEQKCYDQAQEIKALRKLREACDKYLDAEGLADEYACPEYYYVDDARSALMVALAACDEVYKEVSQCPTT